MRYRVTAVVNTNNGEREIGTLQVDSLDATVKGYIALYPEATSIVLTVTPGSQQLGKAPCYFYQEG